MGEGEKREIERGRLTYCDFFGGTYTLEFGQDEEPQSVFFCWAELPSEETMNWKEQFETGTWLASRMLEMH